MAVSCLLTFGSPLACGGTASNNDDPSDGGASSSPETSDGGTGGGAPDGGGGAAVGGGGDDGAGGSANGGTGGAAVADGGGPGAGGVIIGGTGGSTAAPGVETLGTDCDSPGVLACAGNRQPLSLLCDASGTWVANGTCSGTQVCDTGAVAAGSCQEQLPECVGRSPGDTFCSGWDIHACGVDNVDSQLVQECGEGCVDGECFPIDAPCPDLGDTLHDCSNSCQAEDYWCDVDEQTQCQFTKVHGNGVVRIPAASTLCEGPADCPELKMFVVNFVPGDPTYFKVNLPPDWSGVVLDTLDYTSITHRAGACGVEPITGCVVLEPQFFDRSLALIPTTPDAAERNIVTEYSLEPLTCP